MRSIIPPLLRPSKTASTAVPPLDHRGRQVLVGYGLAAALLAVPVAVGVTWAEPAQVLLHVLAIGAIAVGVLRHAPGRSWPWVLMALATGAWGVADHLPAGSATATNLALLYLAGFIALAAALLRLRRSARNGLAPAGLLDTLTVTLLLVLLVWVTAPAGPGPWPLPPATFVIGAALLAGTALRLVVVGPPTPAVWSLLAATVAALAADVIDLVTAVDPGSVVDVAGATSAGGALSLVESVATVCLGAAALHPSMARLTDTEPPRGGIARSDTGGFSWVVAVGALVAPAMLLVEAVRGEVRDGVLIAVIGAALILVALVRTATTGTAQNRSLLFQASIDTLTGLASRAYLMRRLSEEAAGRWSAVLLIDLDEFRQVNEAAGPSLGDAVLITLAERMRRLAGPGDIVARFGGDEFAILVAGPRDLTALTVEVVAATTEPVTVAGRTVHVSACVGLAVPPSPTTGDHPTATDAGGGEEMVRRAGMALRAAKAAGPGEWCRYDSDRHALLVERLRLREALTRAVDEGAFRLAYQPIVALATGETVGFEALVRWAHPSRGLVSPAEFIAVAEETGLIEAIGDLVLRTAVAEAVGWPRPDVYISVNVSPRQLRRPGFAERVEEVLTGAGLPAERLMLELTESALTMRGEDQVWGELAVLRDRGVRLAIDDFGTGFSSLSYLEQTPIGVIKMDKSFVDSLVPSERQRTVVDGIVAMARKLDLQVVAEGIESLAERDVLAAMGCPYGQGYLYSAPLTSTEVIGWLTHHQVSRATLPAPRPTTESTVDPGTTDVTLSGGGET